MTDAYLVTVMLVLFVVGGLLGSGLTVLGFRRRELLRLREQAQTDGLQGDEAVETWRNLDQLSSRCESLEERVEFTERLLSDRRRLSNTTPDPA